MSETYVECLVKPEAPLLPRFLRIVLIMLTVVFGFLTLLGIGMALLVAILAGVGAYFAHLNADVEYEYLYFNGDLDIDQIVNKQSRKRKFQTNIKEDMDFMGPVRMKDVEEAQQKIVNIIRKLEDSGEIIVARGGGDEIVV